MAISEDLINFDLIETHKENILQLPGGRSARQLASVLSPLPTARSGASPTLDETKTLNDAIRQEYELEVQSIADSDDPLDIFDRYVKWTLNAYPSAQATPQSKLLPLLERATKAFLTSSHYKNDPRYLKLWLHYIRLFSDAPRETFAYLARHNVGEGLGLFYEEFAAWLENAGRWSQADEVYKLGIEREARPAERLMRKYNQFQQRHEAQPQNANEPSSPALPTVRPALAAKMDPFASTPRSDDPQAARSRSGPGGASSRSGKPKMAIFSDANNETPPSTNPTTNGWDSIGSIAERKKENTIEARPWTGEVLKAGKKVGTVPKMEIFKDRTLRNNEKNSNQTSKETNPSAEVVNPRTGRSERVFVNLEAVYPKGREEYSFEELRARNRGWLGKSWKQKETSPLRPVSENPQRSPVKTCQDQTSDIENLSQDFQTKASIDDNSSPALDHSMKPPKQKRMKVREIKQETQTVKTRLESPTGRKMKRKNSAEPTMTFHSKAATDEIYSIFNQPVKPERDDTQSGDDGDTTDLGDDTDYSTAGESTGTGRISGTNSEFGDEESQNTRSGGIGSQPDSVSPWSDFTASKHVPKINLHNKDRQKSKHRQTESEDLSDVTSSQLNQTQTGGFDTQAIAAIAGQDFGEMDTKVIAALAGDDQFEDEEEEEEGEQSQHESERDLKTPVESSLPDQFEIHNKPRYVPLPPEDYDPTPLRPFRDPMAQAQSRLPFMTPIVEKTESSVGVSTAFADQRYFNSKTPSHSRDFDSPSKLNVNELLLSSPQRHSPGSATKKRFLNGDVSNDLELSTSSPQKRKFVPSPSPRKLGPKIPFDVTKPTLAATDRGDAESATERTSKVTEIRTNELIKLSAQTSNPQPKTTSPIIKDLQVNPCLPAIRAQILASLSPPLTSEHGYHDNSLTEFRHYGTLASYAKSVSTQKAKASPRKNQNEKTLTKAQPPILRFEGTSRVYAVKKLLGKGAFAPVYLVDSFDADSPLTSPSPASPSDDDSACSRNGTEHRFSTRGALEALKTDYPAQNSAWEFHILRTLASRLGHTSRAMQSVVLARECHVFADEAYLVLDYHAQGTLLDLVNVVREDNQKAGAAGKSDVGVDEVLVAWVGVELLRTLEAVHSVGILHGDLKADNCLVRLDGVPATELGAYDPAGGDGWGGKGITLIDFGRGIDLAAFDKGAAFLGDWPTGKTDCVEMREARPWRAQIDHFGAAGVLHSLLFGRYIDTLPVPPAGQADAEVGLGLGFGLARAQRYRVREACKRYWNSALWADVFGVLVNSGVVMAQAQTQAQSQTTGGHGHGDGEEAVRAELRRVRAVLQAWLLAEGERDGRSLRKSLRRVEALLAGRR